MVLKAFYPTPNESKLLGSYGSSSIWHTDLESSWDSHLWYFQKANCRVKKNPHCWLNWIHINNIIQTTLYVAHSFWGIAVRLKFDVPQIVYCKIIITFVLRLIMNTVLPSKLSEWRDDIGNKVSAGYILIYYFLYCLGHICIWERQVHNVHLKDEWSSVIPCTGKMDSFFSFFHFYFEFFSFILQCTFLCKSEWQVT